MKRENLLRKNLVLLFLIAGISADTLYLYQVGNSWTRRSWGALAGAQSLGKEYIAGHHIAWNKSLSEIQEGAHHFSDPCKMTECLPNRHWDIVELQPWNENWKQAAGAAIEMAKRAYQGNPEAEILIYACGPGSSHLPYLQTWNRTDKENLNDDGFQRSKMHYELIVDSLRTAFPGKQIGLVPVGHAIARVGELLEAGETIPSCTSVKEMLERSGAHTEPKGSYILALAHYCAIFRSRPHGMVIDHSLTPYEEGTFTVPQDFAEYMWDMVWEVAVNEPYCIGLDDSPLEKHPSRMVLQRNDCTITACSKGWRVHLAGEGNLAIELFSANGSIVYQAKCQNRARHLIPRTGLSSGLYMLRIRDNSGVLVMPLPSAN